ncbi:MAG: peptidylprolyl isomerase [Bacteroidales bacterium]|nr:peptidylprolyl isomerase [Bacteroidales bacterium]
MKKVIKGQVLIIVFALCTSIVSHAQNDEVLLTIDNRNISKSEFERIYHKNNNNIDPKSVDEYLDLFINFKLKVIEAENLGMDTLPSFIKELSGYRKQLAAPYLEVEDAKKILLEEAYQRTKTEVSVSHILIKVDFDKATPKDTLEIYNKLLEVKNKVEKGESFEKYAEELSDDTYSKSRGGNLGYFNAFKMIYPFECEAFNTPVGKLSMPFRTVFGYHLIKVNDRRESPGQVKIAHIWVSVPRDADDSIFAKGEVRIMECYNKLKNGEDFGKMALEYSDDKNSARNGGELNWFGTGVMIPEFENTAFALKNKGDISEPLKTSYGFHIIKLLDKQPVGTFEELEKTLDNKLERDQVRKERIKAMAVQKFKAENNFKENTKKVKKLFAKVDTTLFQTGEPKDEADNNVVLFTLNDKTYTFGDFIAYIKKNNKLNSNGYLFFNDMYKDFVATSVIDYQDKSLESKYPDFRYLMEEYHDGILLFDLTDKMVWSKAIQDTSGLEKFYEDNKAQFVWEKRVNATIYTLSNKEMAEKAKQWVSQKAGSEFTDQEIKDAICTAGTKNCIQIKHGLFEKGDHKLVDTTNWEKGVSPLLDWDGKFSFVVIGDQLEPSQKEFDEARGLVTAEYQNYLEKQWIEELRKKYTISVNKGVLGTIK